MKRIKLVYYILCGAIFLGFVGFVLLYYCLGHKNFEHILQSLAVTIALCSSIIAVAVNDKIPLKIKFIVSYWANLKKDKEDYVLSNLDSSIKPGFESFGETFSSYQVYFKIKNISDFPLELPTITLRMRNTLKHPNKRGDGIEFRTNLYNDVENMKKIDWGNSTTIANSNLPFLNSRDYIKIWIRMCLNTNENKAIRFRISVNSKNAEGGFIDITTTPNEVLSRTEE